MSFVTPKREMVTRVGTLLVTHTILDEKLSKFDVIIHQHLFMTNIEETCENSTWL